MTIERLDVAVARTLDSGMSLREVLLVGHADRTGRHDTNQALAQARVQTVRDYLVAKGIPAAITRTSVQGDRQPVSACQGKYRSRAEALECLLPSCRVEVNFVALRQP